MFTWLAAAAVKIEDLFDLAGLLVTFLPVALVLGWLACSASAFLA